MEKFDIEYKDQKIKAKKMDDNRFLVTLPTRKGSFGKKYHETISRDIDGWLFCSTAENDSQYYCNIWLKDDGKMVYKGDGIDRLVVSESKFDPNSRKSDMMNSVSRDIYDVVRQFYQRGNLGIDVTEVANLRKSKLAAVLKLLGYSSIKDVNKVLDISKSYKILGSIGKQLENYRNIGAFVHRVRDIGGVETFGFNIQSESVRRKLLEMIEADKAEVAKMLSIIEVQDEQNAQIRDILPDYSISMDKTISPEDRALYSKVVRETALLYLRLNADLLPEEHRKSIKNLVDLRGLKLEDTISSLIDSKEFAKACSIEDRFAIREAERFADEVDAMVGDDENIRKTSVGLALETLKRRALSTRDRRDKLTVNYREMSTAYSEKSPVISGSEIGKIENPEVV